MQLTSHRYPTRNLKTNSSHIRALCKILRFPTAVFVSPSTALDGFELTLAAGLGILRPAWEDPELVLYHRFPNEPIQAEDAIVWLNLRNEWDTNVSARFGDNAELANAIRRVLESPLWNFVCDEGRRIACIFCGRELHIPASRVLGYGPDCAKHHQLYWFDRDAT